MILPLSLETEANNSFGFDNMKLFSPSALNAIKSENPNIANEHQSYSTYEWYGKNVYTAQQQQQQSQQQHQQTNQSKYLFCLSFCPPLDATSIDDSVAD